MGLDISKVETIVDTIRNMSSREISVLILVVASSVGVAFWVENRYAKLQDTQKLLTEQQLALNAQQKRIEVAQRNITYVINSLPNNVREEIIKKGLLEKALDINESTFIPQQK